MPIKENTKIFINRLLQLEANGNKEIISDLLLDYLQGIVLARSVDTFTEKDSKVFDEVITAITIDNKYIYDNYVTEAVSKVLDVMCEVVNKYADTKEG